MVGANADGSLSMRHLAQSRFVPVHLQNEAHALFMRSLDQHCGQVLGAGMEIVWIHSEVRIYGDYLSRRRQRLVRLELDFRLWLVSPFREWC
jgi:hypothetical protein